MVSGSQARGGYFDRRRNGADVGRWAIVLAGERKIAVGPCIGWWRYEDVYVDELTRRAMGVSMAICDGF